MKAVNILIVLLYLVSIITIPISFFNINGKIIIGLIGYITLLVGGVLTIIRTCILRRDKNKQENNSTIDK